MNNPHEKEFTQRLEWLLSDRKLTPWAKKLGLSSGTAARLLKNVVPGSDILTAIMRTEHVNLNWLLEGRGLPFMLDSYTETEAFENMLSVHAQDAEYDAYLCFNDELKSAAVVLTQPAAYTFKDKSIAYHQIETLCGPYKSPFSIERALTGCNINYFDLPEFQFPAFTRGQYGTYKLLGDDRVPGMVKNTQGGTQFAMYKRQEAQHYDHIKPISHYKFSMDEKLALLDLIILTAEEHKLTEKLDRKVKLDALETLEEMNKRADSLTPKEVEFALRASVH